MKFLDVTKPLGTKKCFQNPLKMGEKRYLPFTVHLKEISFSFLGGKSSINSFLLLINVAFKEKKINLHIPINIDMNCSDLKVSNFELCTHNS